MLKIKIIQQILYTLTGSSKKDLQLSKKEKKYHIWIQQLAAMESLLETQYVVGDFYNWLSCGMFGATDNLFDLRDRESDDDREVLDTGGVPAKGTPTVKSVHIVLEDPCRMQK